MEIKYSFLQENSQKNENANGFFITVIATQKVPNQMMGCVIKQLIHQQYKKILRPSQNMQHAMEKKKDSLVTKKEWVTIGSYINSVFNLTQN